MVGLGGGREQWSVVVTAFGGVRPSDDAGLRKLIHSLPDVGALTGFELAAVALGPEEDLPVEVANGRAKSEAEGLVQRLSESGVAAYAVATADLPEVRYRLADLLPDYVDEGFGDGEGLVLSKVEGLVVSSTPLMARGTVRRHRSDPDTHDWEIEDYVNHFHYGDGDDCIEESVREGRELMSQIEIALRQTYPDLSFTICLTPRVRVSFWQTAPDSPREPEEGQELVFVEPCCNTHNRV